MNIILTLFYALSFTVFSVGLLTLVYYPLSLAFVLRKKRPPVFHTSPDPLVSIIVPAYNEGKVIGNCVQSILASNYTNFEVILVDDGSKDDTLAAMRTFESDPRVQVIPKANGGKASALNTGITAAKGEILFFVDADGIFTPTTIREMLNGFSSEKVGAVCGNDAPVNLDRIQTQLACIQTHVGTGFVRRALAQVDCLPIVSGNIGAFRREVIEKTGPFLEGFIGEDLELTWRVHKAGYRVNFAPQAVVLAEVPSTIQGLWKQRLRWARGLLQTVRIHPDVLFNRHYGLFGFFLPINVASMVILPLLQLVVLVLLPILVLNNRSPLAFNLASIIGWFGLGFALVATLYSIVLNRAWKDLRYLYAILAWVPYSIMMNLVMAWAIAHELRGTRAQWNKLERTGVITRRKVE
ncbi:MAG: glycosyltransferase family 2 protein [Anaerolineaceae bacterium]|nr:glycosyltransferase family 2 protein [Anaerolineaceae bacterium]